MIDHYKDIKPFLDFSDPDKFYFIQILLRKKDNPEMRRDVKVVKQYDICSEEDYDNLYEQIRDKCLELNARAYINMNRKSYSKVAHKMINFISDSIYEGKPEEARNAFYKTIGSSHTEIKDKIWIIDIDTKDEKIIKSVEVIVNKLHDSINEKKDSNFRIITINPSKNGFHILCNPFDIKAFNQNCIMRKIDRTEVDIKKEGTTVLISP